MIETPTFIDKILAKIVQFLRNRFTPEQRLRIRTSVDLLIQLSIQSRKNMKWFNDLLQKQPDIIFVGF